MPALSEAVDALLPSGRVKRMVFVHLDERACPGPPSVNSRVALPSCSIETSNVVSQARGAPATTSSVPSCPTTRTGFQSRFRHGAAARDEVGAASDDGRRENEDYESPQHGLKCSSFVALKVASAVGGIV